MARRPPVLQQTSVRLADTRTGCIVNSAVGTNHVKNAVVINLTERRSITLHFIQCGRRGGGQVKRELNIAVAKNRTGDVVNAISNLFDGDVGCINAVHLIVGIPEETERAIQVGFRITAGNGQSIHFELHRVVIISGEDVHETTLLSQMLIDFGIRNGEVHFCGRLRNGVNEGAVVAVSVVGVEPSFRLVAVFL